MSPTQKATLLEKMVPILKDIPTAVELVKKGGDEERRFRSLAKYLVDKALKKDALIVSDDGNGIAILFRTSRADANFWAALWGELGLIWRVTGLRKAWQLYQVQQYVKKQRPAEGEYLYCWFWGVVKGTPTRTARLMKDEFLRRAQALQLPIYAETRMPKKVLVYQRYGFDVFHKWTHPNGETVCFMKYIPPKP